MCVDYCVNNDNNTYEISAQGIDECMLNVHLLLLTSGSGDIGLEEQNWRHTV